MDLITLQMWRVHCHKTGQGLVYSFRVQASTREQAIEKVEEHIENAGISPMIYEIRARPAGRVQYWD